MAKTIQSVLMVDDEPDIRRIGEIALSAVGKFRVHLASSGKEALELAAREQPDVILLDVMMPEMDGPATFAKLRGGEATKTIPVIFMTAKVQRNEVAHYIELGAIGVVAKPFDPMSLSSEIQRIVTRAP